MKVNLHKNRYIIVFGILMLISGVWMLINGARSQKTFIDECWSYTFINSDDTTFLYPKYKDSWVLAETLKNYLTVQKDERFVYRVNKEGAVHPPLYHFLLHTVCSLFPDTYSKWYGLGINFVFFIGTSIMLFLLSAALFKSHKKAVFASCVWMFSMGALNIFLFIRMYSPLTFFVVCALYYAVKYFIEQKNKHLIGVYVSFILGGLTEFTFWIVGFLITVVFFVLTIKSRRKWLTFGGVALASVATASLLFPPTVLQFLNKSNENSVIANSFQTASTLFNPREVFNRFLVECKERFFPFVLSNKVIFFTLFVSLIVLIYNVVRNLFTEWWNNERKQNRTNFSGFIKERFVLRIKEIGNNPNKLAFIMLFFVYGIAVYFIEAVHLWPYGWHSTRFIFMLYPMQSMLIALIVIGVYKQIKSLSRIPQCIVILLIAFNFVMFNNGKKPLAPAYNWFVYEDAKKYEQFSSIVSDAHVFYVRKSGVDNYLFNSMARFYDKVKEVYPMQREGNPPGYDYRNVIAGQIEQIQSGEKIVIMNLNEDGALLTKDTAFMSLLNSRGFDIVTVETGIDIGHYNRFNVYGVVPYPDTPALKQERIRQETDITRYLSWIRDERYSVLIAVRDECSISMNEEIVSKLWELGLTQDLRGKVQLPYIAVIDRGDVVYEALGADIRESLTWTGELRDGSEYEILSAGLHAGNTCVIALNKADYAVKRRGLNIVVYDNETREVLDSVAFDTWAKALTAYRKRSGEWTELLIAAH